jgi:hypothetical protein
MFGSGKTMAVRRLPGGAYHAPFNSLARVSCFPKNDLSQLESLD